LTGHISAVIMNSRGTTWPSWYIVWNFRRVWSLKYFGVVLRN